MNRHLWILMALCGASSWGAGAASVHQWDFNGNLASATGGSALVADKAAPASAAAVVFTNATINGQAAQVALFTRGTFFRMTHGLESNGGGSLVNQYTLILDVMFPNRPTGWAVLWQTSANNNNDGDWFINPNRGIGISGNYGGDIADGTWHRLALVLDNVAGTFTSFINGVRVQQNSGVVTDGRFSLGPVSLLFADENQENASGYVNSVQIRAEAMIEADLAALGGPHAAGIPTPATPSLRLLRPNGGESFAAGGTPSILWETTEPGGVVQIDLYRGSTLYRTLGQEQMRQTNFVWNIDPRLGDTNNYRVKISSLSYPAVMDSSDGPFSVEGSLGPPSVAFGQPLQRNGGFEMLLADWQSIQGHSVALASSDGKGTPHGGARFWHGGRNPAGDAVVRQEIDLLGAGFTAEDLDAGAALDAEAWLRNWFSAGIFDDQVFYRVVYLNASGEELSSLRCLVAAHNAWLQRFLDGLLPPGTRTLRLEVVARHRRDLDNDSMADDLVVRLQPFSVPAHRITKLPMLQGPGQDAMTMLWETDANLAPHAVEWGRSNVAEHTFSRVETLQIDSTHFVHRATITGLEPETRYLYRVRCGGVTSPVFNFRTAPRRETPFAVAWWGDNHGGTLTLRTHVANLLARGPDFIAVAGDMVNSGNAISEWHDFWFKPLEHLNCAQTKPIIFARGNHDGEHALAYAYSALPGNEAWFAFDYGNTRFIFLDSEVDTSGAPQQHGWLRAELARAETRQAAFRIVCFHRPPWVNLWNGGGHTGETWVRNDWVPLFEQGKVDIVINGHAHNYNRGMSNGVAYVISGGGGGTLDVQRVANWPLYTVEYSRYHFGFMEVNGDQLTWEVYDINNQLLDTFTLKSRAPSLGWRSGLLNPNGLGLVLSGRPGSGYVLETSTNLSNWTPLTTNLLSPSGLGLYTNSVARDGGQRFFRARAR